MKISLRVKTILLVALVFLIFIIGIGLYVRVQYEKTRDLSLNMTSANLRDTITTAVNAKKDVWLTNSLQIARNPLIIKSIIENDRDSAIAILKEYGNDFKESTNFRNVRVHLISANCTSFVKSWSSDSYGETLDYSIAYKEVLDKRAPIVTMEEAPNGIRLKGLFPISSGDNLLGIANFEGGLNSIKRDLKTKNIDFLYLISDNLLPVAKSLSEAPAVEKYRVSQKDTDEEFLDYCQNRINLEQSITGYFIDSEYLTTAVPIIHNTSGKEVGMYIIGQRTEHAMQLLTQNRQLLTIIFTVYAISALIILFLIVIFLEFNVIKPVRKFTEAFMDISGGDLSRTIEISDTSYLGNLAKASRQMVNRVREFIIDVQQTSINIEQSQTQMVNELRKFVTASNDISFETGSSEHIVDELKEMMGRSSTSVNNIDKNIHSLADRVIDYSSAVSQTTSSMNEMSTSIGSISKIAQEQSVSSGELVDFTTEGSHQLSDTNSIIDEIAGSIDEIMQLTFLINDIAEQTNLLAMNAAIEAAHAGEHGKGFAVVAEEIRKLVESTNQNSSQISTTLDALKNKIQSAVGASHKTSSVFSTIKSTSEKVANSFQEINSGTSELNAGSQNMIQTSEQLRSISEGVQNSTEEIRVAMNDISGMVQTVEDTSGQVHNQMDNIRERAIKINCGLKQITESSIKITENLNQSLSGLLKFTVSEELRNNQIDTINKLKISALVLQHAHWVTLSRSYIDGECNVSPDSLINHEGCELGKWIKENEKSHSLDPGLYKNLKESHDKIHLILKDILDTYTKEAAEEIETKFSKLVVVSDETTRILSDIRDCM